MLGLGHRLPAVEHEGVGVGGQKDHEGHRTLDQEAEGGQDHYQTGGVQVVGVY